MFVHRGGNHQRGGGLCTFFPAIVSDLRVSVPNVPPLLVKACASPLARGLHSHPHLLRGLAAATELDVGLFVETAAAKLLS